MTACDALIDQLEVNGFAVVSDVVKRDEVAEVTSAIEQVHDGAGGRRAGAAHGIRNALQVVPEARRIAEHSEIMQRVHELLGDGALCTRAILFDKNPAANWAVPWHQDTTIAVRARPTTDPPGFGPWSIKAGVHHVQPPAEVLASMLTLRVHLDDCGENNAPLRVIPGSHRQGILEGDAFERVRRSYEPVTCTVATGGILLMRPLLLHASSAAISPAHRRVLHLEWAAGPLPAGLDWNRA
jgi:ectoine hydroxylase-related dioxygenase (phytanoyl-CoA dioxygenase family)